MNGLLKSAYYVIFDILFSFWRSKVKTTPSEIRTGALTQADTAMTGGSVS
jgi:hypothetical protein